MTDKPMTQIIRELITANFPIEILGRAQATSQFGETYTTFVGGRVVSSSEYPGEVRELTDGEVNSFAIEWISQQPKDHDVVVWRLLPEERNVVLNDPDAFFFEHDRKMTEQEQAANPPQTVRRISWRLHTMSNAQLVQHLTKRQAA